MNNTPEAQAQQDRAHLWSALQTMQEAHNTLCLGNPHAAQLRLKVGAKALHQYLKPEPVEVEGIEEVAG